MLKKIRRAIIALINILATGFGFGAIAWLIDDWDDLSIEDWFGYGIGTFAGSWLLATMISICTLQAIYNIIKTIRKALKD